MPVNLFHLFLIVLFVFLIITVIWINNKITDELIESNNDDIIYPSQNISNIKNIIMPNATIIPLKIFQTGHTKHLPPKMKKCVLSLKKTNPEFIHYLFDDKDCREFIKNHFEPVVLESFDTLIPGAFKADLWRYCVLYIHGGIYLDIKYCCVGGFKLIELTDDEYFVKDASVKLAVYNALMVCKPKNPILLNCIKQIVYNVKTKYYGTDALIITGPHLMIDFFTPNEQRKLNRIIFGRANNGIIIYNNRTILMTYPEYRNEQLGNQLKEHYGILWKKRQIYAANDDFVEK
jgi:mannosyltransferase OCH1-like enzyme